MKQIYNSSFLLLFIMMFGICTAQDCASRFAIASELYNKGQLNESIEMLLPCIESETEGSDLKRLSAHELLSLNYLENNDTTRAIEVFRKLLKLSPEYIPTFRDLSFVYEAFRTKPVLAINIGGGSNVTEVHVLQKYGIDNTNLSKEEYGYPLGYQFFAGIDFFPSKRFAIGFSAHYFQNRLTYQNDLQTATLSGFNFSRLNIIESQTWLHIPLEFRYSFQRTRSWRKPSKRPQQFVPYLLAGGAFKYLLDAKFTEISRSSAGSAGSSPLVKLSEDSDIDLMGDDPSKELRERYNYAVRFGAGLKYKIGIDYLFLEVGASSDLKNVVVSENRYGQDDLHLLYAYVDNDFRISNISLSVGYIKLLYNPKLKRRYRKYLRKN